MKTDSDMYLVLQRCTMDDIPIGLFNSQSIAEDAASTVPIWGPRVKAACKALEIDPTTPVNTAVLRFNPDGTPRGMKIIHTYTDKEFKEHEKQKPRRRSKR